MRPLLVKGQKGLGDNLFARPFIRAAAARREVYLETPWPEIFSDLPNVLPVAASTTLRTQAKNMARQPRGAWFVPPSSCEVVQLSYGTAELRRATIVKTLERQLPLDAAPFVFDLPADLPPSPIAGRYVLARPVTLRREWLNAARNPDPRAVARAVLLAQERGDQVIGVADLDPAAEVLEGGAPGFDEFFHRGEFAVRDLLALVKGAAYTLGGVGWLTPASIAAATPSFTILGGQLAHNGPAVITDPRMNLTRAGWAMPDRPCRCEDMRHRCTKRISNLDSQFAAWARKVEL